jgi:hypothetical protein
VSRRARATTARNLPRRAARRSTHCRSAIAGATQQAPGNSPPTMETELGSVGDLAHPESTSWSISSPRFAAPDLKVWPDDDEGVRVVDVLSQSFRQIDQRRLRDEGLREESISQVRGEVDQEGASGVA